MKERITLRSLFDSRKIELEQKLAGLTLPKDNLKVQEIISDYLTVLFDSEGEFRQSLTQAEDYILKANLSLLNAQQEIAKAFVNHKITINTSSTEASENQSGDESDGKGPKSPFDFLDAKVSGTQAGLGGAAGALVGNLTFGGWGAVFGAIAGTAIVVYLANSENGTPSTHIMTEKTPQTHVELVNEPINVQFFINVIENICDSVDNLINTFRSQINRVVDKYEAMEKPTIEKDYSFLLESIQSLLGYKRTHSPEEEKYLTKLQSRIEDLSECLENYNLTIEDYNGENDYLFEAVASKETIKTKMILPAIVKDNIAVLKGKIFVPETNK